MPVFNAKDRHLLITIQGRAKAFPSRMISRLSFALGQYDDSLVMRDRRTRRRACCGPRPPTSLGLTIKDDIYYSRGDYSSVIR